jgi:hypothetical protein
MFKFVKVAFGIYVPRMLFKDIQIGSLEIKLGDLLEKAHITGSFSMLLTPLVIFLMASV